MSELVLTTIVNAGEVWHVQLNRPHIRNAVDRDTAAQLASAFRAFDSDPIARVAVLSGVGDTFCAGADLTALSEDGAEGASGTAGSRVNVVEPVGSADGPMGPTRMLLSKPVIAAISGFAVAGGLELALWADLRVVDEEATLGVFCRRFGVPLIDGGTVRLPQLIGLSRALDLILTGRAVAAQEALAMGLVNRLAPKGTSVQVALELAHSLTKFPQTCMRTDRLAAYAALGQPTTAALQTEYEYGVKALTEARKGAQAFKSGSGRHGTFTPARSSSSTSGAPCNRSPAATTTATGSDSPIGAARGVHTYAAAARRISAVMRMLKR